MTKERKKSMKVLSLFSGIGAFEKALNKLDIEYELVGYSEIDKYASKSYSLIHNVSEEMNLGDITKINEKQLPKDVDLITYGFPCQDISLCGRLKGFEENGELTRSGLFFEALRLIEETKPKYAIAENVKNLTSKRFSKELKIVLDSLEEVGYNNYYKVLNAKDYGMPQTRERLFIVSIRKDIDKGFAFPEAVKLEKKLSDLLEEEVDAKYFLDDKTTKSIVIEETSDHLKVKNATKKGYLEAYEGDGVDTSYPKSKHRRGRVQSQKSQTLTTSRHIAVVTKDLKLRYLTPRECWRLTGFDDHDIDKCIAEGMSDAQLYARSGNSIVVDVLKAIFESLELQE